MKLRPIAVAGLLAAASCWTGCATHHCPDGKKFTRPRIVTLRTATSVPVAGVIPSTSNRPVVPSGSAKLVCIVDGTDHGTQWCPFVGNPPSHPVWLYPVPGDSQIVNVNQPWNVMFTSDGTGTAPDPLYNVNLQSTKKTKLTVHYEPQ